MAMLRNSTKVLCPNCRKASISLSAPACSECGFQAGTEGNILDLKDCPHDKDYSAEGAANLAKIEDKHFWFYERSLVVLDALCRFSQRSKPKTFVDLGCGTGYMMKRLEHIGIQVIGIDMHKGGLEIASKITNGLLICGTIENIHLTEPADAIGMFDVIEHIADDKAVLHQAASLVGENGLVVITVPALQKLWSQYDVNCGHKRRYQKEDIIRIFNECDVEPLFVRYFFLFAVFPIWIQRVFRRKLMNPKTGAHNRGEFSKPPNPALNLLFKMLARMELLFAKLGLYPLLGTSLIAIGKVNKSVLEAYEESVQVIAR